MTPPRSPPSVDDRFAAWRRSHDPAELGALFDAVGPSLFRLALSMLHDGADAEDALQETFLAALESAETHDPARPVTPWLVGILKNKVRMAHRGRARLPDPHRLPERAPGDTAHDLDEVAPAERAAVEDALQGLEEPYRSVALLRWRYRLEPGQIADVRGEPPGTTRSILSRALGRLRELVRGAPAVFLGVRVPRGLDAVREAAISKGAPLPPPAPPARPTGALRPVGVGASVSAGALALVAGGSLMGKKSVLVGVAALVAVAVGVSVALDRGSPPDAGPAAPPALASNPPPPTPPSSHDPAATLATAPPRTAGAGPTPVPAAPSASASITGLVTDTSGTPIRNARVLAIPDSASTLAAIEGESVGEPRQRAVTGLDGRFTVSFGAEAPGAALFVSADGFAPGSEPWIRAGQDTTVILVRPASLRGHVRDAERRPIAGARVRLRGALGAARIEREVVTDREGAFRIEGLPAQRPGRGFSGLSAWVEASAEGYAPVLLTGYREVDLSHAAPGSEVSVEITLGRGTTLEGTVTNAATSTPLAGARVVLISEEGVVGLFSPSGRVLEAPFARRILGDLTTGADGRYRFEHVPALGPHTNTATAVPGVGKGLGIGRVLAWSAGFAPSAAAVPLESQGATRTLDLPLAPAGSVGGRVVNGRGQPIAGAHVAFGGGVAVALPPEAGAEWPRSTAVSEADGRYVLAGIPATVALATFSPLARIEATTGGTLEPGSTDEEGSVDVRVVAGATTTAPDLVLRATDRTEWVLRVRDVSGRPVFGALVTDVERFWDGRRTRTDAEGVARYRAIRDPGARLTLRVAAPGFARVTVPLPEEPTATPTEVVLERGRRLAGVVRTTDGHAVAGATVEIFAGLAQDELRPILAVGREATDGEGRFRVDDLPVGPYTVVATLAAATGKGVGVGADAEDVVVVIDAREGAPTQARARLEVRVLDATSRGPIAGARGQVSRALGSLPLRADDAGVLVAESLPVGTWALRVEAPGHAARTYPDVTVGAGDAPTTFTAELVAGATVRGSVRRSSDARLRDRVLSVALIPIPERLDGPSPAYAPVADDGTFRLEGVAAGAHLARVIGQPAAGSQDSPALAVLGSAPIEVPPAGGELSIVVEVAVAGTLAVLPPFADARFPYAPGSGPVAPTGEQTAFGEATTLEVLDGGGRVVASQTGVYRNAMGQAWSLAPGRYLVRLRMPKGETREREAVVEEGKPLDLPAP